MPVLSMLPFRASVLLRSKRWFKKGAIPSPYAEKRLLCPSPYVLGLGSPTEFRKMEKWLMLEKWLFRMRKESGSASGWK